MPKRSWKVIENHPNYKVSSMGDVMNIRTEKLLNPYDDGSGYLRVKIDGKCERLHILVAMAFVPNPDNKPIVNHKKGKKKDCRASQLEWVTQSENIQHAWDLGLFKVRGGGKEECQGKILKVLPSWQKGIIRNGLKKILTESNLQSVSLN